MFTTLNSDSSGNHILESTSLRTAYIFVLIIFA
jgi:hypothetical protein